MPRRHPQRQARRRRSRPARPAGCTATCSGKVTGGTFNPNATCTAECWCSDFCLGLLRLDAQFSCSNDYAGCRFGFEYTAQRHHRQGLRSTTGCDKGTRRRDRSSATRSAFHGDIAERASIRLNGTHAANQPVYAGRARRSWRALRRLRLCDPSARVSPQRRTALFSIVAACVLIAVKLVAGIATNSLGLLSEAAHSGTDLVAAILTFVALGVAIRPADPGHAYGHGKAEHLAALAEAAILVVASLRDRLARALAAVRARLGPGRPEGVGAARDRRGDRHRRRPRVRLLPRRAPLPKPGAAGERASLRERPRRLDGRAARSRRRALRATTGRTRWRRCSWRGSCCSPRDG